MASLLEKIPAKYKFNGTLIRKAMVSKEFIYIGIGTSHGQLLFSLQCSNKGPMFKTENTK